MSGNYDQIKNSNVGNTTTVSDQFVQLREGNGRYVYKHAGYYNVSDKKQIPSITPTSAVPATLNNAVVDFKIDNGSVDILQYCSLHMSLTNNTGAACTLVASPLWVQYVEIFAGNGSSLLTSITADDLYQQFFFLDRATYESQASAVGLTAGYASLGTSVANTASITLNLPLYHFFKAIQLAICGLKSSLLLRFHFNSTALTHLTGTAMTATNLQLVLRHKNLKNDEKNAVKEIYSENSRVPLSLSHLQVDRMQVTQALVANGVVSIPLSGVHGVVSYMIFTVRLATDLATPTGQINYVRMNDWDILDGSARSLIGAFRRDNNVQQIDYSNNYGNDAWNQKQFHMMAWSANPRESFSTGNCSGRAIFTGNERLSFTCGPALASGSYVIEIKAYYHANLIVDRGNLRIERD